MEHMPLMIVCVVDHAYGDDATTSMAGMDADMMGNMPPHAMGGMSPPMYGAYATRSYGWDGWPNDASYAS